MEVNIGKFYLGNTENELETLELPLTPWQGQIKIGNPLSSNIKALTSAELLLVNLWNRLSKPDVKMEQDLDMSNFQSTYSFWNWSAACAGLDKLSYLTYFKSQPGCS